MEVYLSGKRNIYEEIVETYAKYIRTGALRAGEKLPSCRGLAMQLGINPNTVERAYSELEKRGLIRTLPKKGAFVQEKTGEAEGMSGIEGERRGPPGDGIESAEGKRETLAHAKEALVRLKQAGVSAAEAHALIKQLFGEAEKGEKR